MTKAQAIKGSIEHWKRMIAWVKKQPKSYRVSSDRIEIQLGEDWYADYCPLCKKYYEKYCDKCPLYQHVGKSCNKNPVWTKFTLVLTRNKWIENAKKMLKLLEELL